MTPATSPATRANRRPNQDGHTLIELLVASGLLIVMLFAILPFLVTAERKQIETGRDTEALSKQQLGLERMTREIRQAASANVISSQVLEVETYAGTPSALRRVRYDCSVPMAAPPVPSRVAYTCRRSQGPAGGPVAATSVVLMDGVVNLDVFRGLPAVNATFVELVLRVDRKGRTNPITLRDGIELRNRVRS